jgi:fructokinase
MEYPNIVGLGEALFDVFEGGREEVGGAPLNFAFHANAFAKRLGKSAAVVSSIGQDARGATMRSFLSESGMPVGFLQQDARHPTGFVLVTRVSKDLSTYEIVRDVAWDFIESSAELDELAARCELVCFGTLAQRSPQSKAAIERFLSRAAKALRLFDVNLRQDFYDTATLRQGCSWATVLKVDADELKVLAKSLNLNGTKPGEMIISLFERFPIEAVILTQGPKGTVIYTATERFEATPTPFPAVEEANSVGAGDAATAGAAVAMLAGHPLSHVVKVANAAGGYVAAQKGATPPLPDSILNMVSR